MTKLFLHIGPHKTGSTYIQKYCFDNRDRLQALGLNYPNVGIGPQFGHHQVVEKVKALPQKELTEYMSGLIGGEVNLVSSENFDRLKAGDIAKLGAALSSVDVRIVYYRRNYADLLPSSWQERVKHRSRISFYEFVLPHLLRPMVSKIINPCVVLDLYASVFGKDKITIIDYDAARKKDGVLRPIFDLLAIDPGVVKDEVINRSVKIERVEIIRALNSIAEFNGQLRTHNIRALFLRKRRSDAICDEVEDLTGLIHDHMKPLRLGGGYFTNAVNVAVKRKYQSCFFGDLREDTPKREVFVPSDNWMLEKNALKSCEHIYRHIMAGDIRESERKMRVRR